MGETEKRWSMSALGMVHHMLHSRSAVGQVGDPQKLIPRMSHI